MGLPESIPFVTIQEYLRAEETATERHEYMDGAVYAMSGGTQQHSEVKVNLVGELRNRLKGKGCRAYDSDFRIFIPSQRCYFYPDASIICGGVEKDPHDKNAAINPTVLFEVLSPSTEARDRSHKMLKYRECESLSEYVLLHTSMALVEVFHREDSGQWLHSTASGLEAVALLPSIALELPLASLYEDVEFPPDPPSFVPYVLKESDAVYSTN